MSTIAELASGLIQQPWHVRGLIGADFGGLCYSLFATVKAERGRPRTRRKCQCDCSGKAIGGAGGGGGVGRGGDGGDAKVVGDGMALGGEGGEAGQVDRGGRGGRSPLEVLGVPNRQLPDGTWLWDYGRGGDGGGPKR
jgi:hypothetical protein